MRTLLTTTGKVDDTEDVAIGRCFTSAHTDGFWLDIEPPDAADFKLLEESFKFHPLTIEDIQHQNQRPKIDEYPDYNFAVIFQADWVQDEPVFREHHLFVGPTFLVSVHLDPAPALEVLKERLVKSPDLTKGQPSFLTYLVVDTVDQMEDDIIDKAAPGSLDRIYHLKHAVIDLRRFLGAQRDVFQKLVTHGIHLQQQDRPRYTCICKYLAEAQFIAQASTFQTRRGRSPRPRRCRCPAGPARIGGLARTAAGPRQPHAPARDGSREQDWFAPG